MLRPNCSRSLEYFTAASRAPCAITQSLRGNADTAAVQGLHSNLEAFAFFAEQIFFRNFAVFKNQFSCQGGVTAHLVFDLAEAEARHAFFYDESGNAVYASALIGHSKDDIGFSFAAVGDEDLGAVQDDLSPFRTAVVC